MFKSLCFFGFYLHFLCKLISGQDTKFIYVFLLFYKKNINRTLGYKYADELNSFLYLYFPSFKVLIFFSTSK